MKDEDPNHDNEFKITSHLLGRSWEEAFCSGWLGEKQELLYFLCILLMERISWTGHRNAWWGMQECELGAINSRIHPEWLSVGPGEALTGIWKQTTRKGMLESLPYLKFREMSIGELESALKPTVHFHGQVHLRNIQMVPQFFGIVYFDPKYQYRRWGGEGGECLPFIWSVGPLCWTISLLKSRIISLIDLTNASST